ncbi:uncharacterized protein LOC121797102 [Salvia splendens]|uniref:uncharacterized protein LOC121797102 n=1 Tax=Salvia splendens TaxID=180675 RepID=UPI001C269D91|nr:uncharacterized protein LOC121797102 [Salvia splendens]
MLCNHPRFTVTDGVVNDPKKMTTEDILKSFMLQSNNLMEQNNQRMEKVETDVQSMATHLKNIDTQISQISQTLPHCLRPHLIPFLSPRLPWQRRKMRLEKENTGTTSGVKVPFPQMPKYAKFLKEVIAQKTSWGQVDTINLTENCSALLQRKLPAKLAEGPWKFHCRLPHGGYKVENALYDLGASINLMPLSVFKQLNIGTLKPTSATLQMADISVAYPEGIVEDLLIKVGGEFIFPADFMVLDMEEDNGVPLLLGRPFLATVEANINVKREIDNLHGRRKANVSHKPRSMDGRTEECKVVRLKHQVTTGRRRIECSKKSEEEEGLL